MIERGGGEKKKQGLNRRRSSISSVQSAIITEVPREQMQSNPCVCVCVCTCSCAVSAQVTVLSKGSLIIVGVIMEISVRLTIGADDKKKNYLFWCFCFLISCPLEISRDFYYRACVFPCLFFLFLFLFGIPPSFSASSSLCVWLRDVCFPIIILCPSY